MMPIKKNNKPKINMKSINSLDVVEARLFAESSLTSVEELNKLADYDNKYIKQLILTNPNCDHNIAIKLSKDKDNDVVLAANKWIAAFTSGA